MNDIRAKYDRLAAQFSTASYANLGFYMRYRFELAVDWKPKLCPGDRVIEVGCGDGHLAELFVRNGFRYTGLDLSPQMVGVTQGRLDALDRETDCFVADVNHWRPTGEADAVIGYMRSFFAYVNEPSILLARLARHVRKKIIVDLDPRRTSIADATTMLRKAGFRHVEWRPFLVPNSRRMPVSVLRLMSLCEGLPVVRSVPLRWKFHVLLKGEV
jgi:SAM-dependent methyltransferase